MAKKTEKKISINTLKKAIKENPVREKRYMINIDDEPVEIIVNPYLTIEQYTQFINDIVVGCVTLGEYVPSLREFSEMSQIIGCCTNISTDNISVLHDFIHCYPDTANHIYNDFVAVFPRFAEDVREAIDFEIQKYLHTSSFDLIANKIVSILDGLENQLKGISTEDISKLTGLAASLANKNETGIAKAVLDYQKNNASNKDAE